MNKKIERLVNLLVKKYGTNNPEILAAFLNTTILRVPLDDIAGYYKYISKRRYIFINEDIEDDAFYKVVLAHELGHAIMHMHENSAFIRNKTLLLTSRLECQANMFAAYLLIPQDLLVEYSEYTTYQFSTCTGIPEELINLRIK